MQHEFLKGRGAQNNPANKFLATEFVTEHWEGIDEDWLDKAPKTQLFMENPKKILSFNTSPDIPFSYSLNPYQGCEHGCLYCYARNSHQYWGFSAGLDFETKIVVKKNAAQLLEKQFLSKNWESTPVMLSGNTDCYQPIEKKLKITRQVLQIFAKYANPVGIITKNALILRDLDILKALAAENLVHVYITIISQQEDLRRVLEPRAVSTYKRLKTIELLAKNGIPAGLMMAPIIPGLNNFEIPPLLKSAADAGAVSVGYTMIRLNGQIGEVFKKWLEINFPDRADKVWHQIESLHGGQVNDSRYGLRQSGEGKIAEEIHSLFKVFKNKYFKDRKMPVYNLQAFRKNANWSLF
jgi:DNA repair photolyase